MATLSPRKSLTRLPPANSNWAKLPRKEVGIPKIGQILLLLENFYERIFGDKLYLWHSWVKMLMLSKFQQNLKFFRTFPDPTLKKSRSFQKSMFMIPQSTFITRYVYYSTSHHFRRFKLRKDLSWSSWFGDGHFHCPTIKSHVTFYFTRKTTWPVWRCPPGLSKIC